VDGSTIFTAENSMVPPMVPETNQTILYQQFITTFVASSTSTALAFLNGDAANDTANALDNITLTDLGRGCRSRPDRRRWTSWPDGPDIGGRSPSRLVATAERRPGAGRIVNAKIFDWVIYAAAWLFGHFSAAHALYLMGATRP
jgi:hypothetical protein